MQTKSSGCVGLPGVIGITPGDHGLRRDLIRLLEGAVLGGLEMVILREPTLAEREYVYLARKLSALSGLRVVLHGSQPDALALAVSAGWDLHLPAGSDFAGVRHSVHGWLGASCHSLAELSQAEAAGCDYATLSPIFSPLSKPGDERPVLDIAGLQRACRAVSIRVVALGGIRPEHASACRLAGAAAVASLGGFFPAEAQPELSRLRVEALRGAWYGGDPAHRRRVALGMSTSSR